MIPFELAEPKSLAEAIKLLDPDDAMVRPFAGGTALMLMMKAGVFHPTRLVSLGKIERKYTGIAADKNGLRIGAMTTLSALEHSADVRKLTPVITRTLRTLSNVRVRNVATVGGRSRMPIRIWICHPCSLRWTPACRSLGPRACANLRSRTCSPAISKRC